MCAPKFISETRFTAQRTREPNYKEDSLLKPPLHSRPSRFRWETVCPWREISGKGMTRDSRNENQHSHHILLGINEIPRAFAHESMANNVPTVYRGYLPGCNKTVYRRLGEAARMARTFSLPYSICVLTNPVVYLLLFVVLLAPQLRGQTTSSWNDGTGHWSKATDWTPNGAPNNGGSFLQRRD